MSNKFQYALVLSEYPLSSTQTIETRHRHWELTSRSMVSWVDGIWPVNAWPEVNYTLQCPSLDAQNVLASIYLGDQWELRRLNWLQGITLCLEGQVVSVSSNGMTTTVCVGCMCEGRQGYGSGSFCACWVPSHYLSDTLWVRVMRLQRKVRKTTQGKCSVDSSKDWN